MSEQTTDAAVAVREPEPLPRLSSRQISSEIQQLLEAREEAEADGDAEAVAAMTAELDRYVAASLRAAVDRRVHDIRGAEWHAAELKAEIDRLTVWWKRWTVRAERLKDSAFRALQSLGIKEVRSDRARLYIRGNGGVQPLEVNPMVLAPEWHDYTVTLTEKDVQFLETLAEEFPAYANDFNPLLARVRTARPCPSNTRIRTALLAGEKIIGAKLAERGDHLRVE